MRTNAQASEYTEQAQKFLDTFGFTLTIENGSKVKSPPWLESKPRQWWSALDSQYITHGFHYLVTITRAPKPGKMTNHHCPPHDSKTFEYWGSVRDRMKRNRPTPYDILTTISLDANSPTDPDDVCSEYGDMKPANAIAIADSARDWQTFFFPHELDALSEIR